MARPARRRLHFFPKVKIVGIQHGDEKIAPHLLEYDRTPVPHELDRQKRKRRRLDIEAGQRNQGQSGLLILYQEADNVFDGFEIAVMQDMHDGNRHGYIFGGILGEIVDNRGVFLLGNSTGLQNIPGHAQLVGDVDIFAPARIGRLAVRGRGLLERQESIQLRDRPIGGRMAGPQFPELADQDRSGIHIPLGHHGVAQPSQVFDRFILVAGLFVGFRQHFEGNPVIGDGLENLLKRHYGIPNIGVGILVWFCVFRHGTRFLPESIETRPFSTYPGR